MFNWSLCALEGYGAGLHLTCGHGLQWVVEGAEYTARGSPSAVYGGGGAPDAASVSAPGELP